MPVFNERWEYVTSDEQGNDYYINRNFGAHITLTSIDGNIFYASFKKVLNDGGLDVEANFYDINRGRITERKILAYAESIIRFRNKNGIKEFSFYSLYGYTADNFIITGWKENNIDSIYDWQPINDEVYNALYNVAYENLK